MALNRSDYIRYLIQEGKRACVDSNSSFYSELFAFIDSPEGKAGFLKFTTINSKQIGIKHQRMGIVAKRIGSLL